MKKVLWTGGWDSTFRVLDLVFLLLRNDTKLTSLPDQNLTNDLYTGIVRKFWRKEKTPPFMYIFGKRYTGDVHLQNYGYYIRLSNN